MEITPELIGMLTGAGGTATIVGIGALVIHLLKIRSAEKEHVDTFALEARRSTHAELKEVIEILRQDRNEARDDARRANEHRVVMEKVGFRARALAINWERAYDEEHMQAETLREELRRVYGTAREAWRRLPGLVGQATHQDLTGRRILVVEDEKNVLELLAAVLSATKADVRTAISVADAMDILEDWIPHLIVSDLSMPKEDGFSFMRRVRAKGGEYDEIPAIAFSGFDDDETLDRAAAAGFDLHLSKPPDNEKLATIASLLASE